MTQLRVTITNTAPTGGTALTPFWLGFHDGSFDLFDGGQAASAGLEQIAEDGDATGLGTELLEADADGQGFVAPGPNGPILAGDTAELIVDVDGASNGSFSFAAMILPSNDAFVGNGGEIELFNDKGRFLGEQTITLEGSDVYDAGTEVNTELDAAFINQTAPNTGVDENGVVRLHPGFNGSAGNPEGEGDQIILGGTNAFGQEIAPVAADFTLPGAQIAEIHINTVVFRNGSEQRDFIFGRRDDDIIDAGGGRDLVFGGRGWDVIDGGAGRDKIFGGAGNDEIAGGKGKDILFGGRGDDSFLFASGDGHDIIGDFRGNDTLVLAVDGISSFEDLAAVATDTRRGLELDFGSDGSIYLRRADLDDLEGQVLFL